jgi:anti-sigma B factor antagonist
MSEDAEPFQAEILRLDATQDGTGTTITLDGEFDLSTTERFKKCVIEVLGTRPQSITVVAVGLRFIDSSGLAALLNARAAADDAGVPFRITEPSPALRRIVEIAGIEDWLLPDD